MSNCWHERENYYYVQSVLVVSNKPLMTMIGRQKVKHWFENKDTVKLPDEKEVFKSGTSFVNYIHLQVSLLVLFILHSLCLYFLQESEYPW